MHQSRQDAMLSFLYLDQLRIWVLNDLIIAVLVLDLVSACEYPLQKCDPCLLKIIKTRILHTDQEAG